MSKTLWIAVVVIAILVVFGVIAFIGMNTNSNAPSSSSGANSAGSESINPAGDSSSTPTASAPKTYNAQIKSFAFNPRTLTIKSGDTVVWTNMDSATHTVVSNSGSEISSSSLATGQSYSHTFSSAGTYAYYCSVHPSMKGTIIVE